MQAANTNRDPYFDNAKFILIVLMVFGHFCFELREIPMMMAFCNAIYSFHMPMFIIISGYFSRSIVAQRKSEITLLLLPYLILEMVHYAFTKASGLGKGHLQFFYPTYQNWYILSLFFWRMLVPYYRFIKKPLGITLVILVSLGAGFVSRFDEFLSLYRTLYLFPFFLIGYYATDLKNIFRQFSKQRIVLGALFILLFTAICLWSLHSTRNAGDLFYAFIPNFGYTDIKRDFFLRTAALFISFLMSFLFLFLIPDRKTFFSKYGSNTMTVFMFHIFVTWSLNAINLPYISILSEIAYLVLALALSILLSGEIAVKIFKPFTDPVGFTKSLKLFKKQDQ